MTLGIATLLGLGFLGFYGWLCYYNGYSNGIVRGMEDYKKSQRNVKF